MADPLGFSHDNSIDGILSEGSSRAGTPRRVHPARFPKPTTTSETQGTLKSSRLASPQGRTPTRTNSIGDDSILSDLSDQTSPLANRTASRKNSGESQGSSGFNPSTPSNANTGKNTKGRTSTARRSKMKNRKSIAGTGVSEDESSASESEGPGGSEKIFEKAFQRYDKNDDGQIPMSDFLHFFDTLQTQLPPLSEPLLQPGVREQMLDMMSQVMAQSGSPIYISKNETKDFYKSVAGKDITQELNDRRQGTFKTGEVSSFRGRLEAARIPEDIDTNMETPRRGSAISPERRTPFGGSFARPTGPRRQQSFGIGPFGDVPDDESSELGSAEPSAELTGNFLASSTPAQVSKRPGHGYFSPPLASPTQSTLSFGEVSAATGLRAAMGSPAGFNASAMLEQELAIVHRELKQKQADYDEKEQELNELRLRVDRNREEFEDEIMALNEEGTRLRKELGEKRAEISQLNRDKDELRAEAAVYLDQVSEAKKEVDQFHHQHSMDRENIMSLAQDNQKYAKQAADALRRVEALTADLQTVMEQKEEIEAQRASLQRKADLMTGLHKQIKDLREDQKEREFEIDRLRSELHSRQMDIEMLMTGTNPTGSGGKSRLSAGPGTLGLLSDELEGAGVDDEEEEEEEDDEEEEVVTTTKTIKRKKKPAPQKRGDTASPEPFEIIERIAETSERGIQCDPLPWTAESGTSMEDDSPVRMFTTETQTDVTLPVGTSLQDHYEALAPLPPLPTIEFSMDEEGLQRISEYEELAKEAELSRQQLDELSKVIGVQAEVIERLKMLGEANAAHKVRKVVTEKLIPGENPIAYLNYATFWLQNWLYFAIKRQFFKTEKGDEWADFLAAYPQPDMTAVTVLLILFISIFLLGLLIVSYSWKIHSHDAMWKQLNTLKGYPRNPGNSGALFGSRTWRVFKYDLQRWLYGQVRFPV